MTSFKWLNLDKEYDMNIIAGFIGVIYEDNHLIPQLGWLITPTDTPIDTSTDTLKENVPEQVKKKETYIQKILKYFRLISS